ncbi:MAG: DoxX family protein [Fimbriimonas sp.]
MIAGTQTAPFTTPFKISNRALWTGRILSSLAVLFLTMDGAMKLVKPAPVVDAMIKLGYPDRATLGIGILLLGCTLLYSLRPTAILGAVLLTGYLGGAVSTHVRVTTEPFSIVFPVIVGALVWGGLYLRDARVRALLTSRA